MFELQDSQEKVEGSVNKATGMRDGERGDLLTQALISVDHLPLLWQVIVWSLSSTVSTTLKAGKQEYLDTGNEQSGVRDKFFLEVGGKIN